MNNSLAALEAIRKILKDYQASIRLKPSENADSLITQALLAQYSFNGTGWFGKNQQAVSDIERQVKSVAKQLGLLESKASGPFGYKYTAGWSDSRNQTAQQATKKVLDRYFETRRIRFPNDDVKEVAVSRLIRSGFVAEFDPGDKTLIQFRRLAPINKSSYWSDPFPGDQVIMDFIRPFIDSEETTLAQRELEATFWEKAKRAVNTGPSKTDIAKGTLAQMRVEGLDEERFYKLYKAQNNDLKFQFKIKDTSTTEQKKVEFANYSLWEQGTDETLATHRELSRAAGDAVANLEKLKKFEVPPISETDKPYTNVRATYVTY